MRFVKGLFLLLLLSTEINAEQLLCIDGRLDEYTVPPENIELLVDSTGTLSFQQVLASNKFARDKDPFPHIRTTSYVYWVKFTILSTATNDAKRWVLEALDPHFTNLQVYQSDETGQYLKSETGIGLPFSRREYLHKNFVFDVPLRAKEKKTFYLRLESNNHNVFLFKLRTTNFFAQYALNEYYVLGVYYGILFIMALYNLLLFFTVKENFYLYYVVYVFSCALLSFAEDGIGFHYFWPNSAWFNPWVTFYSSLVFLLCFTLYAKSFLELKHRMPLVNKAVNLMLLLYCIYFMLDLKWFNLKWDIPVYALPYLLIFTIAIKSFVDGFRPARFFIFGYSIILISIFVLILRMNGMVGWDNVLTIYCFNIGIVFEIVILSLALGDKIRSMKAEKEQAQQLMIGQLQENEKLKDKVTLELEQKVQERTREIQDQKEIIEEQNKELGFANERLLEQSQEISRMNALLNEENKTLSVQKEELSQEKKELIEEKTELEGNVKELNKARILMKDVNFSEFGTIFPDKDACMKYLVELKWRKGYKCIRCSNEKYFDGHELYSRRCTRCGYDESATAYTMFHRLRFPIQKAFYMLFLIYSNKGKITSQELSGIVTLRQSTCWSFRKKVQEKMAGKKKAAHSDSDGWSWLVLEEA